MQTLFIAVAIFGILYFLLARRTVDLLSLGYASACAYFLPGFFGEVIYPLEGASLHGIYIEIVDDTYLVMTLVLLSIIAAAKLLPVGFTNAPIRPETKSYMTPVAVAWGIIGFLMTVNTVGYDVITSVDKNLILEEYTRWGMIWSLGATIGLALAVTGKRPRLGLISLALLLIEVYVGFRSSLAAAVMATFLLILFRDGEQRLVLNRPGVMLLGLAGSYFLFAYKLIYVAVKAGDWQYLSNALSNPDFYINAVMHSEPFLTQAILNQVMIENYYVGPGHLTSLLASFILFAPELGFEVSGFNDLVQPHLFGSITQSGIAANIWAEGYAIGGWPVLVVFIFTFTALLCLGTRLLARVSADHQAFVAVAFCYFAFLIHRNDLLIQVTVEKRVLMFFVLCWASEKLVRWAISKAPRKSATWGTNAPLPMPRADR